DAVLSRVVRKIRVNRLILRSARELNPSIASIKKTLVSRDQPPYLAVSTTNINRRPFESLIRAAWIFCFTILKTIIASILRHILYYLLFTSEAVRLNYDHVFWNEKYLIECSLYAITDDINLLCSKYILNLLKGVGGADIRIKDFRDRVLNKLKSTIANNQLQINAVIERRKCCK